MTYDFSPDVLKLNPVLEANGQVSTLNIETCTDCGIKWKPVGSQCPVCFHSNPKSTVKKKLTVRSKYRNQPVTVGGERYDSGKEAARAGELALLLKVGEIIMLACHVRLLVSPEGCAPIYYEPDFIYVTKDLKVVVEDTKPLDKKTGKFLTTRDYKLKKKLFQAKYKIEVMEV